MRRKEGSREGEGEGEGEGENMSVRQSVCERMSKSMHETDRDGPITGGCRILSQGEKVQGVGFEV